MTNKLVIGIGGAGCYLASQIQSKISCHSLAIDKTGNFVGNHVFDKKMEIAEQDYNYSFLNESFKTTLVHDVQQHIKNYSTLVLPIGLGGYLGTTLGVEFARFVKSMGIKTIAVVYLPFAFEKPRHKISLQALADLRACVDDLIIHDHATQLVLNESQSMLDYFIAAGQSMVNQLNNILSKPNA